MCKQKRDTQTKLRSQLSTVQTYIHINILQTLDFDFFPPDPCQKCKLKDKPPSQPVLPVVCTIHTVGLTQQGEHVGSDIFIVVGQLLIRHRLLYVVVLFFLHQNTIILLLPFSISKSVTISCNESKLVTFPATDLNKYRNLFLRRFKKVFLQHIKISNF